MGQSMSLESYLWHENFGPCSDVSRNVLIDTSGMWHYWTSVRTQWTDPKLGPLDPRLLVFMACVNPFSCEWDPGPASNWHAMAKAPTGSPMTVSIIPDHTPCCWLSLLLFCCRYRSKETANPSPSFLHPCPWTPVATVSGHCSGFHWPPFWHQGVSLFCVCVNLDFHL